MTRFLGTAVLFALLDVFTFALAKRGKGGGSSDGSSSSGSDSSGSSSGGSSRPKGTMHTEISGAKWPYRWPGSYYNGSMTLDVSIEYWPDCSERKRNTWRTNLDGLLMLGPGNGTGSFDETDPNFLVMGWDAGITPTSNWTDGVYWSNGGPGAIRWFSTDVKVMLSRFIEIWPDSTSSYEFRPYDHGWSVDADPMGNGTNEYSINGTWSGTALSFTPGDNSNNNFMYPTTTLCNNATIIDTFKMDPYTWKGASQDWDSTMNTTFRGTFNDRQASITWSGNYWAGFNSIDYGVPGDKDGYPQGYFSLKFDGVIDDVNSDRLVARTAGAGIFASAVGGPDWVAEIDEDVRLEDNQPIKRIYYSEAASLQTSGLRYWIGFAAVMACMTVF